MFAYVIHFTLVQLERGEAEHLMPVFNAKEKVRTGKLKVEDIPYMQVSFFKKKLNTR